MEHLKKCPFCGGEVGIFERHDHRFEIWHGEEDVDMNCPLGATECVGGWIYDTKEHAITAWNTRKPMERIVERLEEIADNGSDLICVSDNPQYYDGFEDGALKAIEIVNEEMC